MRFRLGVLGAALAACTALVSASASDAIVWMRVDGTPGWTATIPPQQRPGGASATPLAAPLWFAKFPDTKIATAPEGRFDVSSARGKVLLVDYWASWCGPCLKELPHLQSLHLARSGDGLVAVAVNADEDAASAADSAKRLGLTMTIGLNDNEMYRTLGVRTLPTLFAVDRQGRLRARWDGYRPGLEREIAGTVDKLLADDAEGTTREVAGVIEGAGRLEARWLRDLPGSADGVVGLPPGILGGMRVVAAGGDELLSFDAAGEAIARLKIGAGSGRLYDLGAAADGTRQLAGFRPGATSVRVIALRSGDLHTIALPAPLIDLVVTGDPPGDGRRITVATPRGAAQAKLTDDRAAMLEGRSGVRSVAAGSNGAVLTLSEDGTIGTLDGASPAWKQRAPAGAHVLAARTEGAVLGSQAVMAAVSGRFLPGDGRQLAVATYNGHVALVDEESGRVIFDAAWSGVHDLGVADLDGDGRDELLVSAGRSIVALGAPKR